MRIVLFLLLLCSPLLASRDIYDDQLWLYYFYEHRLSEHNDFYMHAQARWRDGGTRLFRNILEGEVIRRFTEWFEAGPGYRNDWDYTLGATIQTHTPFIDIFINIPAWVGRFRNRFRPQYFFVEDAFNCFSVRNRLTWFLPTFQPRRMKIEPYLEEEVFWRTLDGFFENRVYVGARIPLFGCFYGNVVYIRRMVRAGPLWEHNNILALHLRYRIRDTKS